MECFKDKEGFGDPGQSIRFEVLLKISEYNILLADDLSLRVGVPNNHILPQSYSRRVLEPQGKA